MKIYIQTKGRYETISTHLYCPEGQYRIVVHNNAEKKKYLKNKTIPPESIIVSHQPFNLAIQRNWIKENLVKKKNRWFILMDDNIKGFSIVPRSVYGRDNLGILNTKDARYARMPRPFEDIESAVNETVRDAKELGFGLVGFSNSVNLLFRQKKYRNFSTVCQKFCVVKNDDLRWHEDTYHQNDNSYTALSLIEYGGLLLNNYIYPIAKHYESGGLGTLSERAEFRVSQADLLIRRYPGLFVYTRYNKNEWLHKSCVNVNIHRVEKFAKWKENWVRDLRKRKGAYDEEAIDSKLRRYFVDRYYKRRPRWS